MVRGRARLARRILRPCCPWPWARPLADRLRPSSLNQVVGQDHLLGPEGAIKRMVDANRLTSMFLWGPPGCGKTTVITEIVQQLVDRGERILVTGQTNVSVDNVLKKITHLPREFLRVGHKKTLAIDKKAYSFLMATQLEEFEQKIKKLINVKLSIKPFLAGLSKDEVLNEKLVKDTLKPNCVDKIKEETFFKSEPFSISITFSLILNSLNCKK